MAITDETLDLQDAAGYLKIHPDTLQKRASNGEIPGAKVGRAWVFVRDELRLWLRKEIESQTIKRAEPRRPQLGGAADKPRSRRRPLPQLPDQIGAS